MFYTSPYKRTRETTEGIAQALEENGIQHKIYQEPRLREQDFGNFQGGPLEMNRVWKERAHYGHLYVSWFFMNWTSKGLGFSFFFFAVVADSRTSANHLSTVSTESRMVSQQQTFTIEFPASTRLCFVNLQMTSSLTCWCLLRMVSGSECFWWSGFVGPMKNLKPSAMCVTASF